MVKIRVRARDQQNPKISSTFSGIRVLSIFSGFSIKRHDAYVWPAGGSVPGGHMMSIDEYRNVLVLIEEFVR